MKVKLLIACILIGFSASAQNPSNYLYRATKERLIASMYDSGVGVPSGIYPRISNGQSVRSGALFVDSVGGGRGLWYYESGTWYHAPDSATIETMISASGGVSGGNLGSGYRYYVPSSRGIKTTVASNGLTLDSATSNTLTYKLGGTLTAATTINQSTFDLNISGTGTTQIGTPISTSTGRFQVQNPTAGGQSAAFGQFLSNNVFISSHHIDSITSANNGTQKSTGIYNRRTEVMVDNNLTVSGKWAQVSSLYWRVRDSVRLNPLGSDLVNAHVNQLGFQQASGFSGSSHIRSGLFSGDYTSASNSDVLVTATTGTLRIFGDIASHISYINIGTNDSVDHYVGVGSTGIVNGHILKAEQFLAAALGNVDTLGGFVAPYTGAYNYFADKVRIGGSDVNGTFYKAAPSAVLDVAGTTKGVLLPRLNTTQMSAISSPATGLIIYNTDSTAFCYYNGSAWTKIGSSTGGGGGSQTWQQTLTTGSTLTGDNSIAGGGFNLYFTNTGNYRVYGTGSYSSERLLVTSGASGIALLGRESTNVYYQGSDSLYTIGLGQKIDTTIWKVAVRNVNTGTMAYAPWQYAQGSAWQLSNGNAATAGLETGSYIGTNNSVALRFGTNGSRRMVLDSSQNQLRIGLVSATTTGGMRMKNPGNGNYDGYYVESSGGTTGTEYGYAGLTRGGGFTIKMTSSNLSVTPSMYVGAEFTGATALVHIKAGTATASTAPLKFTAGTNLTTPEAGAIEFDGTNFFATASTTRYTLAKTLKATATLDFANTLSGTNSTLTITVTGAVTGDPVALAVPHSVAGSSGIALTAWVSSSDTVTVCLHNYSGGAYDAGSASYTVSVLHY